MLLFHALRGHARFGLYPHFTSNDRLFGELGSRSTSLFEADLRILRFISLSLYATSPRVVLQ